MKDSIPQELLDEVNDKKKRARAKIQQSPSKRRMTEKEGDAAELAAQDEDKDVVRLTKQPSFIQNGQMRAYQIEGLNWLANNYNNGINCILADEMVGALSLCNPQLDGCCLPSSHVSKNFFVAACCLLVLITLDLSVSTAPLWLVYPPQVCY